MKKATKIATLAIALVVIMAAFVVALDNGPFSTGTADTGDDTTPPADNPKNGEKPPSEDETPPSATTITASKTATGFWEKRIVYSWDVQKCLADDICEMQIEPGEYAEISYIIDVERSVCVTEVYGVRGHITVTNTGDCPTEDLLICDTIQYMGECGWVDHVTIEVDVSAKPVLQPGECYAYPYEVTADHGLIGIDYCNVASVTITNFECNVGTAHGVEVCDGFTLPCERECVIVDKTATLTDYFSIPCGFSAVPLSDFGPWTLGADDQTEWEFDVNFLLINEESPRFNTHCISNQCTLVPCDSKVPITACAQLTVTTGEDETRLCVQKTAEVTRWTEYIAYELDIDDIVMIGSEEFPEDIWDEELIVEQECVENIHTLTVSGAIKVVNTGCYPTRGLTIVDTIQMLWIDPEDVQPAAFGGEWEDIASVCVDTSCKPMLLPGEWYYYPYEVTFTIDDVELAGLASYQFRNLAYVEICNYDDDASEDALYDYAPIMLPLCPDMITVETTAVVESCDQIPFGECGPVLNIQSAFAYRQLIVVNNCDYKSTMDVCTEITLNGKVWADDRICGAQSFDVAICHSQSAEVRGDVRELYLLMDAFVDDSECYVFCLFGEEVEVDIYASLYYYEGQMLYLDDFEFEFEEGKWAFGGVEINFET